MHTLDTLELVYRLLAATACGAVLGLNRALHHKSAGFRTFALVSLGGGLATLIIVQSTGDANATSRVIQGVLTGIGFLGAGVIFHQTAANKVSGLSTAAAIWLAAALGIACGAGFYCLALIAVILALLVLAIGRRIEAVFETVFEREHRLHHRKHGAVEGSGNADKNGNGNGNTDVETLINSDADENPPG